MIQLSAPLRELVLRLSEAAVEDVIARTCTNCGARLARSELDLPVDFCGNCSADADSINLMMGNASELG